jgi:3-oxoacyl-[acyl-carrier-protein] synthase II
VEFPGLNLSTCEAKPAAIRATLNTSLGFGGANTCVVLGPPPSLPLPPGEGRGEGVRRVETRVFPSREGQQTSWYTTRPHPNPLPGGEGTGRRDVRITGIGVVLPGAVGNDAFLARLNDRETRVTRDTGPIPESDIAPLLNARRVRRMSDYVKLSLAATALAFADAGIADVPAFAESCAAVLGSTHGSANYSRDYYGQIVAGGIPAANPMLFAEGVPNAAAAHLSLMMSLKGACQTIIGSRTAGLDALRLAFERIAQGQWDRAVVSAGEEFCETVNAAYGHCGLYAGADPGSPFAEGPARGFAAGCGAVTLILESRASLERRGGPAAARARGRIVAAATAAPREGGEVDAADRVLRDLGDPALVIGSANGTWVDRVEAAAVKRSGRRAGGDVKLSSPGDRFAETFSVTPLLGVAAALLGGRRGDEGGPGGGVGVLCVDYSGAVAGVRIEAP